MVLEALGPIRVAKGMTAFEDGSSDWSNCFFARAFEGELNLTRYPEGQIKEALKFQTIVPIRFVWTAFDSAKSTGITRDGLIKLIHEVQQQEHSKAAEDFLKSITFDAEAPVEMACAS
jgi:hypothetical protein